jgi:hypothetical protein
MESKAQPRIKLDYIDLTEVTSKEAQKSPITPRRNRFCAYPLGALSLS